MMVLRFLTGRVSVQASARLPKVALRSAYLGVAPDTSELLPVEVVVSKVQHTQEVAASPEPGGGSVSNRSAVMVRMRRVLAMAHAELARPKGESIFEASRKMLLELEPVHSSSLMEPVPRGDGLCRL